MKNKKIIVVTKYFYPIQAGIENSIMETYSLLAKKTVVYFQSVNNLNDFFIQHKRLLTSKNTIIEHFGMGSEEYYFISENLKYKKLIKHFLINPIYMSGAVVLQIMLRLKQSDLKLKKSSMGISNYNKNFVFELRLNNLEI